MCGAKTRRCESSRVTSPLYHHASRSCLCRLDRGEARPETRQAFEVAEARTSRQVNRVFSLQSAFSSASIRSLIKLMVITEPAVPNSGKRTAWVGDSILEISIAHAQQRSFSIHT